MDTKPLPTMTVPPLPTSRPCPLCHEVLSFHPTLASHRWNPRQYGRCNQCQTSFTLYGGAVTQE